MKTRHFYNRRTWLNKPSSPSTGSVICYYGPEKWEAFVEIASCHNTIRLHSIASESINDLYCKVRLLRDELDKYLSFLDKEVLHNE